MTHKVKKLRIEIWLNRKDSNYIKANICMPKESRKEAIERLVSKEIDRVFRKQTALMM